MELGSQYGCLTILDLGEEYALSDQYNQSREEYDSLIMELTSIIEEKNPERMAERLNEIPSSSFANDLKNHSSSIEDVYKKYVDSKKYSLSRKIEGLKFRLITHYKCQCKCGRVHYYDESTIKTCPKYCYYPVFLSSTYNYSIKARNANYQKRQKYSGLMNVKLVDKRNDCVPSNEYCDLWNCYKKKQSSKPSGKNEKRYTIEEWDDSGRKRGTYEVYSTSHLEALKKKYPGEEFELFVQTDIRNDLIFCGRDYNFCVSNHYNSSAQTRTRLYKRLKKERS